VRESNHTEKYKHTENLNFFLSVFLSLTEKFIHARKYMYYSVGPFIHAQKKHTNTQKNSNAPSDLAFALSNLALALSVLALARSHEKKGYFNE
jgi:hypothetical protein